MSRRKGAAGERQAAKLLTELTGTAWQRSIGQTRRGGSEVADVVAEAFPGIHIEVKRGKQVSLWGALKQATADCVDNTPVVLARRDNEGWVIMMRVKSLTKKGGGEARSVEAVRGDHRMPEYPDPVPTSLAGMPDDDDA